MFAEWMPKSLVCDVRIEFMRIMECAFEVIILSFFIFSADLAGSLIGSLYTVTGCIVAV